MSETPAKNFPATKALGRLAGFFGAFGFEYGLCYVAAFVVSDTLLHGKLDQPVAAIGFWAIGSLASYFVRPRKPKPQPQLSLSWPVPLPPSLIDALAAEFGKDQQDPAAADAAAKPTPYL